MKLTKLLKSIRIEGDEKLNLSDLPTQVDALYRSDDDYKGLLDSFHKELEAFQDKLYAGGKRALLIVFQGMDTSGKDGAISHVMQGVNPQGCRVYSFKTPSSDELKHDFLWRTHREVPARGEIGIFNRSYYEEVLVTRVHAEVLAAQNLPRSALNVKHFWKERLLDIRNHESYLERQGIKVIKFFLHISKEEQKKRLLARLEDPNKNWKISEGDFQERKFWDAYMDAYRACFEGTGTKESPWFIVPADDKKNARILISQILLGELKRIPAEYPETTKEQKRNLSSLRKGLK
jgi:PPK2 family polyphosphate:nucleotide phosphotransferase